MTILQHLGDMATGLRSILREFEPECITAGQATEVLETAAEVERLAGSVKLLCASRAAQSTRWATEGHRSAASWMAEKTKGTFGEAISTIETAERLTELPATAEALKNGELSSAQAKEVASAAGSDHRAEQELLRVAAEGSMKKLKERAKLVKARSWSRKGETERYRAIHQGRYLRHWSDTDGAFRLDARLTPDAGARLVSAIQARTELIFASARKKGAYEPQHAYRADALVALVTGAPTKAESDLSEPSRGLGKSSNGQDRKSSTRRIPDTLVIRVDAAALRRGFVKGTETCDIPGVGPVPVATAERLLGSAFVKIVVKDGVDIATVCHVGRTVPAHVQSALDERDPICVVPQCEVAQGLENHHWVEDFEKCGITSLAALARVCSRHHDRITYEGYRLVGGPGRWQLLPPSRARPPDTS